MEIHDLAGAARGLPTLDISPGTTEAEAMAAHRMLGVFGKHTIGLVRFSGRTPWERHPDDELLHVLDGEVELTLLTGGAPTRVVLSAGSMFVVPSGVWHRSLPRPLVALLFVTSSEGNQHSLADDPRAEG
jgi:quercetin dioxygenase-like cupin family protein